MVWRLSRPPLWMVSILPLYLGNMLATRELFPGLDRWSTFLVATCAMGPLAWGATLCLNDAYDAQSDRLNPRKASSPLVVGLVSTTFSRRAAYVFAGAALAAAGTLGWAFFALVAAVLGLGWAYSVPPLRLKERPGADLATVVAGIGVVAPLAGWAIARPYPNSRGSCWRKGYWWPLRSTYPQRLSTSPPTVQAGRKRSQPRSAAIVPMRLAGTHGLRHVPGA